MTDPSKDDPRSRRGEVDDGSSREDSHVVVLLPPEESDARRTRLRVLLRWALVVAAFLALGYYGSTELGWLRSADPAGAERTVESEDQPASARPTEALSRYRAVADSLETALQRYAVRRSDFERDRIDCTSLAAGYENVDRHFVNLSIMMSEREGALGASARKRYEELSAEVDRVNRHFDTADCRTTE